MQRQVLLIDFGAIGGAPAGTPPSFDVKSGPGTITVLEGSADAAPTSASYETHVVLTGDTSLREDGVVTFDRGGLRLSCVADGVSEPSAEEGTARGAIVWRAEGFGDWAGVTGLVTANFEIEMSTGRGRDRHVYRLFLP
ncbi:hypothetical protein ACWEOE_22385 [Amycolatopsis sp. NPDC004368]